MPEFFVTWAINIDADNPVEAAARALIVQRDQGSRATHFVVSDRGVDPVDVDLDALATVDVVAARNVRVYDRWQVRLPEDLLDAVRAAEEEQDYGLAERLLRPFLTADPTTEYAGSDEPDMLVVTERVTE